MWVGLRGWPRTPSPGHDLARWTAPQTGQIGGEYSHVACQEQPSSVPRFSGWDGGGLEARSGLAEVANPMSLGTLLDTAVARGGAGTSVGLAV